MKGTVLYQIVAEGIYKHIDGKGRHVSKKVFLSPPTSKDIDEFLEKCCNSAHPGDIYDLEKSSVKVTVTELVVAKNIGCK